jgi:hypothetical protein
MDKQLKELYKDYDNAMEKEDYATASKIHETITAILNICGEERYRVTDTDLDFDIYVWDTAIPGTVAAATFEQEYWIRTDDGLKYFDTIQEWEDTVEKYLGVKLSDLSVISESEIKRNIKL